ncbi:MAG: DUF2089 domain-containing protein [Fimbriimonadaceae bacterium]|nr:DUF2089 domain-containing protein [Fimbriimonadaceae bacterium]
MSKDSQHTLPHRDPISGKPLYVSELACEESGVTIRGRFAIPPYAQLDPDQAHFLETFLRCRGMLSSMEKELGVSYPTVRARLDALLQALDLKPIKDDTKTKEKLEERKRKILDDLEAGKISADEAKRKIKEGVKA